MRVIMVMFDSLVREALAPYGAEHGRTPQFERLAASSVVFDRFYAGSMPCMPARRELHTGRPNFLHRGWGPLEPFDDSVPELLASHGVHSHLVSDHQHYWEDGGATYHPRYSTHEFFRGQEGDPWKGHVDPVRPPESGNPDDALARQDWVNRRYTTTPGRFPQRLTFEAGLEFVHTNADSDNWFLQIESFDPHEPFFVPGDGDPLAGSGERIWDWPGYHRVTEGDEGRVHMREQYLRLLEYCDASLGRVLDAMDELELWSDTMLLVCTDHGFMLGEHDWWGKTHQPWYEETIHTPFFLWDPRDGRRGSRDDRLAQTIDIPATLLDLFGIPIPEDMLGVPIEPRAPESGRDAAIFGDFGAHVCVTDGRYVYMRASDPNGIQQFEYTLMPTRMRSRFTPAELAQATLEPPLPFTKGAPVLRIPARPLLDSSRHGTLLFDVRIDPAQLAPLADPDLELRMIRLLLEAMRAADAPGEQYARLGLSPDCEPTAGDCRAAGGVELARVWAQRPTQAAEFEPASPLRTVDVATAMSHPAARTALMEFLPMLADPALARRTGGWSLVAVASLDPRCTRDRLDSLAESLRPLGL